MVPHTGIAASLPWSPTEYGCSDGLRPIAVDSDWLEGTKEGTESATRLTSCLSAHDRQWGSNNHAVRHQLRYPARTATATRSRSRSLNCRNGHTANQADEPTRKSGSQVTGAHGAGSRHRDDHDLSQRRESDRRRLSHHGPIAGTRCSPRRPDLGLWQLPMAAAYRLRGVTLC